MTAKKKLAILAGGALALAGAYQLAPLSSAEHAIAFDESRIERKSAYLDALRKDRPASSARPNIVVMLADDLGKTDISRYGSEFVTTPRIDAIGHNGVTFTDAYVTSSICSPSRASLLTGRYQQRYGYETQPNNRYPRNRLEYTVYRYLMNMNEWRAQNLSSVPRQEDILRQGIPPSEILLSEALQASGYATGLMGKWHLGYTEPFLPTQRGFDDFYGFYEAFTLFSPLDDPDIVNHRHDYFADKHIWAQERNGTCAIRRNEIEIEESEYLTFAIAREAVRFIEKNRDDPFYLFVSFSAPHTPFQAPKAYVDRFAHIDDENKRVYYAMIAALDDAAGTIMDALGTMGLIENTMVWFASDNGGATYTGATGNAPLKGGKFNHFEGGINIPCMLQWEGVIPPGTEMTSPITLMDVFSTSMAAAGIAPPADTTYDGVDLMPYVLGEADGDPHETLFWRTHHMGAVRSGPWKLILDERDGRRWLYDLDRDKIERVNRADEDREVVNDLRDWFYQWQSGMSGARWPHLVEYRFEIDGETYDYPL